MQAKTSHCESQFVTMVTMRNLFGDADDDLEGGGGLFLRRVMQIYMRISENMRMRMKISSVLSTYKYLPKNFSDICL